MSTLNFSELKVGDRVIVSAHYYDRDHYIDTVRITKKLKTKFEIDLGGVTLSFNRRGISETGLVWCQDYREQTENELICTEKMEKWTERIERFLLNTRSLILESVVSDAELESVLDKLEEFEQLGRSRLESVERVKRSLR